MAKIIFAPVCSKCEKVIRQRVDFKYDDKETDEKYLLKDKIIEPECCPNCGAYFQEIIMPQRLPSQLF